MIYPLCLIEQEPKVIGNLCWAAPSIAQGTDTYISNKSPLSIEKVYEVHSLCWGLSWVQSCLDGSIYQALKVKQICIGSSLSLSHHKSWRAVHKSSPCLPQRITSMLYNDLEATDNSLDIYELMIIYHLIMNVYCGSPHTDTAMQEKNLYLSKCHDISNIYCTLYVVRLQTPFPKKEKKVGQWINKIFKIFK